jgi:hypothetical protein
VSWLENLKSLARYRRGFEIAGGLTLTMVLAQRCARLE